MKFITAVLLSCLSLASAAPVEQRNAAVSSFVVRDFHAGCKPNRGGCSWSFEVVEKPTSNSFRCEGSVSGVDRFPDSAGFQRCTDTNVVFQFQHYDQVDQYRLIVTDVRKPGDSVAGDRVWGDESFPIVSSPAGSYQTYYGDSSFTMAASP